MGMIKVKNKGNPVYVGRILCQRGLNTDVNEQALMDFCKTPSGAALYNTTLFAVDGDLKKRMATERNLIKEQALSEARQDLGPVIKKEIEAKLRKEMEASFKALEKKVSDLVKGKSILEDQIKVLKKGDSGSGATEKNDVIPNKPFVFDPEAHTIEHRGAGKFWVMDSEDKKLYGPLTEDEKQQFEEMQKES